VFWSESLREREREREKERKKERKKEKGREGNTKDSDRAQHDQWKTHLNVCRNRAPNSTGAETVRDVCTKDECVAARDGVCLRRHAACGHACGGVRDEANCLPCLHADCYEATGCTQEYDEMCYVCYTDHLGAAPTVRLTCGHAVHRNCLRDWLARGWPGARMTFGFMCCPVCKTTLQPHPALADVLDPLLALHSALNVRDVLPKHGSVDALCA
jgi:hypothetical protein